MTMDRRQWFEERTYDHREFDDVGRLVAMKEEQGVRFSVCLPTRNVSATVGEIIRVFRTELMEHYPLIDQLAIIDSRSSDGTVDIASREGAQVFFDDEILPDLPPGSGKGEALWKSQYVLEGDIIAWIDSDIENIHPRFACGLIGPLLANPDVGYVKGYYQRPLKEGEVIMETGGGRVTELVVRPFLNLFYPDLAGLIQPLSGEYAGRRSVLESVPFLTGYGVETGLILEIYDRFGLESLAQVDLEVRRHHNQPLDALSRMSFAVMQAIFRKLDDDGKISLKTGLEMVYNTIQYSDGAYTMQPTDIEVIERPPMVTVPAYRESRGRS